jgi:hypothetical protein
MNGRPGRADFLACVSLGVLIALCYASELLGRTSFFFFDVSTLNLPARDWAFRQIAGGHFPQWCTHWYLGFPFIAESQSGVYYPPNYFFFLLFPSWYATTLAYTSHLWLAGVGTYFLFRRSSSVCGAWLGATSFALGGRLLEHQIHAAVVETIAWMPLIILGVLQSIERGDRRALWWSAGAAGVQALAGSLQMVVLCHFGMWIYIVSYYGMNWPALRRAASRLILVGIAAVLLSAALLLPTFELFRQSHRSAGGVAEWANFGAISPLRWIAFLLPGAFGSPAYSTAWLDDREPVFETGLYHGGVVLILAFAGLFASSDPNRRRSAFAALLMILVGLSLAAGEMHLFGAGLRRLPVFSGIRIPARFLLFVGFGMCQLAVLGWDGLAERNRDARTWLARGLMFILVTAAVSLGWMYGGLLSGYPPHINPPRFSEFLNRLLRGIIEADSPRLAATLLGVGCLLIANKMSFARRGVLLCLAFDLGWTVQFKYPTIEPSFHAKPASVDALKRLCEPDPPRTYVRWLLNSRRQIDLRTDGWRVSMDRYRRIGECLYFERGPLFDVGLFPDSGEFPLQPKRLAEFRSLAVSEDHFVRLLGVQVCMSPIQIHVDRTVYRGVGCFLEKIPNATPYALFTESVERLPADEIRPRIASGDFDPTKHVVLEGPRRPTSGGGRSARAAARWNGPNQLEIDVEAPASGVLLVHEMFDAGWKATVDGIAVPIERANDVFMAIAAEPGSRKVVFTYAPASVRWGRWISGVSLLVWLALGMRRMNRKPDLSLDQPPPNLLFLFAAFIALFTVSGVVLRERWTHAFPTVVDPPAVLEPQKP